MWSKRDMKSRQMGIRAEDRFLSWSLFKQEHEAFHLFLIILTISRWHTSFFALTSLWLAAKKLFRIQWYLWMTWRREKTNEKERIKEKLYSHTIYKDCYKKLYLFPTELFLLYIFHTRLWYFQLTLSLKYVLQYKKLTQPIMWVRGGAIGLLSQ